jgi:hypothetical protein
MNSYAIRIGAAVVVAATVAVAGAAPSQASTLSATSASQSPASWVSGDGNPCHHLTIAWV